MQLKIAEQPYNFHSHTAYEQGIESCRFLILHHVASYSDLSSSRLPPFLPILVPRKKIHLPVISYFKKKKQRAIILEQTLRYVPTFPGTISFFCFFPYFSLWFALLPASDYIFLRSLILSDV